MKFGNGELDCGKENENENENGNGIGNEIGNASRNEHDTEKRNREWE